MKTERIQVITSSAHAPDRSVLIIYTGGTLGMIHNDQGLLVPFDFASILSHVPSLRQLGLNLTVISFHPPIDSSNMTPSYWTEIARIIHNEYLNFDGFVVLHGTDTMAYTASAISFMLENLNKPVIFTGAQLPITAFRSDARENLITSLEIASAQDNGIPVVPEVAIYFNNVLLRANRSKKVESVHFDAFESENYPMLAESGVVIHYNHAMILQTPAGPLTLHDKLDNRVAILKLFPGIPREVVEAIVNVEGLRAVVLETFGAGNAISADWFIDLLRVTIEKGVVIVNVSQCNGGRVMQGRYETSKQLEAIGVIGGEDLTTESAVTKLMMVLGEETDTVRVKKRFIQPVCGEMTDLKALLN
ncbi:asparaginase [Fulvivirga sedimenti]|uniref:asparaginase n=1 Tax=Fulvivirga sedimenti TaxID=2879465 RepID=A0A9X1HSG0_9BACT|nr:asparaginase [Fulvivirga sedimenti]MCA6075213.1 asparaginase [Fulvivirga sedimenti]MCA6076390.1 asparaginase [Fulvivirga sedimenti]MCA6077518.1 asparaginase [Fulvivirga sedimenti]